MAKFRSLPPNQPRKYEVFDANGVLVASGELSHSNPMKMAKYLLGQNPGSVKVKITTSYQAERHPRGHSQETRTFVK